MSATGPSTGPSTGTAASLPAGIDPGPDPDILCIGSVLWDVLGHSGARLGRGMDVPGRITRQPGGVAMNLAATLARLGLRPAVLTAIGRDPEGDALLAAAAALGVETRYVHRTAGHPTDRYVAIEDDGGLVAAVADARSLESAGGAILAPLEDGRLGRRDRPWTGSVALDGNLTEALLAEIAASPLFARSDLRAAPASPGKALRLRPLLGVPAVTLYVNLEEAGLIAGRTFRSAEAAAAGLVAAGAMRALVTDGERSAADATDVRLLAATPPTVTQVRVTGAGDTFMAAHIAAERRGADADAALRAGLDAAARHVAGL
ncbi:MAG: kinase [Thermoleophilia bacterium]|nr:kinase [Thermoleophilia bacterium]